MSDRFSLDISPSTSTQQGVEQLHTPVSSDLLMNYWPYKYEGVRSWYQTKKKASKECVLVLQSSLNCSLTLSLVLCLLREFVYALPLAHATQHQSTRVG